MFPKAEPATQIPPVLRYPVRLVRYLMEEKIDRAGTALGRGWPGPGEDADAAPSRGRSHTDGGTRELSPTGTDDFI